VSRAEDDDERDEQHHERETREHQHRCNRVGPNGTGRVLSQSGEKGGKPADEQRVQYPDTGSGDTGHTDQIQRQVTAACRVAHDCVTGAWGKNTSTPPTPGIWNIDV